MIFNEKEIQLKNGKMAILRSPKLEDAPGLLEYVRIASEQTDFLTRSPEESQFSLEKEQEWITQSVESENKLVICCEIDGRIVGDCEIRFNNMLKTRHRANVGIAILADYWNLGIGTAMFAEMIAAAENRGILVLDLEHMEGNDRGRHLHEKMGFRVTSERPNYYRLKDGTFRKEYYMQKILKEIP